MVPRVKSPKVANEDENKLQNDFENEAFSESFEASVGAHHALIRSLFSDGFEQQIDDLKAPV